MVQKNIILSLSHLYLHVPLCGPRKYNLKTYSLSDLAGHSNCKGEQGFKGPKQVWIKTGISPGFKRKKKQKTKTKTTQLHKTTTKTPDRYFSWANTLK